MATGLRPSNLKLASPKPLSFWFITGTLLALLIAARAKWMAGGGELVFFMKVY